MSRLHFLLPLFLGIFLFTFALNLEAAERKSDWEGKWTKTIDGANREGMLVIYASRGYDLLFAEFQKKYPKIKVVSVIGRGYDFGQRIISERRGGKYLADLFVTGASTIWGTVYKAKIIDPIQPELILPEVTHPTLWWMNGKHNYADKEGKYIFSYNGSLQSYFAYNSKLVNPSGVRSYWDFLDPRWKGKMIAMDPAKSGSAQVPLRLFYYHSELGPKFLRRFLSETDLTASRNVRQVIDWLGVGKFSISAFTGYNFARVDMAKKQGLPVDWFGPKSFKEGIILSKGAGNASLINRPPHPNARRLAINWLLSREGQIAYQKLVGRGTTNSLRIDIPKNKVLPAFQRDKGKKYIVVEKPEWMDMDPVKDIISEVWKNRASR